MWAASALAGGSSSSSTSPPTGTDQPTAEYVQDGSGSAADENADRECPEGESGAGSSASTSAAFYGAGCCDPGPPLPHAPGRSSPSTDGIVLYTQRPISRRLVARS